jgi:uncharacterized membrane protein YfcA
VSTTVNLAKVATGLSAAISHWRFGNVDRRLVLRLAGPGAIGALIGVTVLANVDGDRLKPILAVILLLVAVRILVRFSRPIAPRAGDQHPGAGQGAYDERGTTPIAVAGGVTNGLVGAWGPVVTPFLLQRGLAPRFAIGSVNTAEVAVAFVASGSLLASIGGGGLDLAVVVAMLIGGVLGAPLSALVVRRLPARGLGVAVAGLLLVTNIRELTASVDEPALRWAAYGLVVIACAFAAARPSLGRRELVESRAAA